MLLKFWINFGRSNLLLKVWKDSKITFAEFTENSGNCYMKIEKKNWIYQHVTKMQTQSTCNHMKFWDWKNLVLKCHEKMDLRNLTKEP
jgi:hypothetical protein